MENALHCARFQAPDGFDGDYWGTQRRRRLGIIERIGGTELLPVWWHAASPGWLGERSSSPETKENRNHRSAH